MKNSNTTYTWNFPTSENKWTQPLKWDRAAEKAYNAWDYQRLIANTKGTAYTIPQPVRPTVFCSATTDWLDDEIPIESLTRLLHIISATPSLDWHLHTNRLENWYQRIGLASGELAESWADCIDMPERGTIPENVWIGTTVEDQATADTRIPQLLRIPAAIRLLNCEPLLGPVDLWSARYPHPDGSLSSAFAWGEGIHRVIAGGEIGPKARPVNRHWLRSLRDECASAGVPFLFTRWGEWIDADHAAKSPEIAAAAAQRRTVGWPGHKWPDGTLSLRVGKKLAGRTLDGQIHAFPQP